MKYHILFINKTNNGIIKNSLPIPPSSAFFSFTPPLYLRYRKDILTAKDRRKITEV